jgi:repressor LexA
MTLTKRQRKILEFVKDFSERRGYAPTLAEIGRHFGLRSPATVHKHLRNLEEKGALRRHWNHSRSIEVLPEEGTTRAFDLPLVGVLEAGRPLEMVPAEQAVPVPPGLVGEGRTFVLRVRGDAFRGECLRDGDFVVIEEAATVADGAMALLLMRGNTPVIGGVRLQDGRVRLLGSGAGSPPPQEPPAELRVKGRVLGVLRKYGA